MHAAQQRTDRRACGIISTQYDIYEERHPMPSSNNNKYYSYDSAKGMQTTHMRSSR